jgi:hypothetical protein
MGVNMATRKLILLTRLTAEELEELDEKVRASGRTRSDFVRHRLLRAGDSAVPAVTADGLREALIELKRCGNNVNQIARKLNAGLATPEVNACLKELSAATAKVAEAVRISRGA